MNEIRVEPHIALLSLGSNLGDRLMYLHGALQELERNNQIKLEAVSSIYETDPVGFSDQPAFLNIAVRLETTLSPQELLDVCHNIEDHFQRERTIHWGPRTIDIDIVDFDHLILQTNELTLPHPQMNERDFVLIPLRELESGEIGCSESVRPLYTNWYRH